MEMLAGGRRRFGVRRASLLATAACAAIVWALSPAAATGSASHKISCASLTRLPIANTQILTATEVAAGAGLPAHCNVVGVIDKRASSQDPDHYTYGAGFAINLPDSWAGRFEMMGGGGTDGSLNQNPEGSAGSELASGWAVAADDGGHEDANPTNPSGFTPPFTWQDDDPNAGGSAHFGIDAKARSDYGYKAMELTTLVAKDIMWYYYGRRPQHSYFWGCSNGGRDAFVQTQRYPGNYDGVVAGNPGFDLPRAAIGEAWNEQSLAPLASGVDANGQPNVEQSFQTQDLEVASAAILEACDRLDGLIDGVIDNYSACTTAVVKPHLANFTCGSGAHGSTPHGGTCLTSAQVAALLRIYAGAHNSSGQPLYSGWYWDAGIWDPPTASGLGFQGWNVSAFGGLPANLTLGAGAVPMVFHNPPLVTPVNSSTGAAGESQEKVIFDYDFDTDAPTIFASAPGYPESPMEFMTGVSLNLAPFAFHRGKMILYSGVNDGIFSGVDLVNWYNAMNRVQFGRARSFVRLFMVPNMAHCGGGPATSDFAANTLSAITNWVENDVAPDEIVAANHNASSPFTAGGVDPNHLFAPGVTTNFPANGTRPICSYPLQTRYKGSGATNDAANFTCVYEQPVVTENYFDRPWESRDRGR
jgi:Tannase and feruloyl esterase